jgi:hypothetical protein
MYLVEEGVAEVGVGRAVVEGVALGRRGHGQRGRQRGALYDTNSQASLVRDTPDKH